MIYSELPDSNRWPIDFLTTYTEIYTRTTTVNRSTNWAKPGVMSATHSYSFQILVPACTTTQLTCWNSSFRLDIPMLYLVFTQIHQISKQEIVYWDYNSKCIYIHPPNNTDESWNEHFRRGAMGSYTTTVVVFKYIFTVQYFNQIHRKNNSTTILWKILCKWYRVVTSI